MATTGTLSRRKTRAYIIATVILLILLSGLLFLLYLFSKPPTNVGAGKTEGYSHIFSIYGFEGDRLHRPVETAVDKDGNIYIADAFKHRIVVVDSDGRFVTKFGEYGEGPTQIQFPSAVAVAPDGRVYVLCASQNKIVIYRDYKPYWVVSVEKPLAAKVKNNRLYITTARGVMIGDLDGRLISNFSGRGPAKGLVDMPNGIDVDDKGNIFVADSMNYRVQAFSKDGKSLWTAGNPPKDKKNAIRSTERTYGLPTGMAVDENGILYFMDAFNGEIVIMDGEKGKEIKHIGVWGHDDGQFYYPGGISYAGNRTFVIADKFNDRVQVVTIPSPVAGPMAQISQYSVPLLVVFFLILLVIWLLRRRKRIVVADSSFIDWAIESGSVQMLIDEFRAIKVPEEVYEIYKDRVQGEVPLSELLEIGKYNKDVADKIAEEHGLDPISAKLLAICVKGRARSTLLADNEILRDSVTQLRVVLLNHDELMTMYEGPDPQAEPAK